MEIEIYPGFSASEVLYSVDGGVMGIATRDMGIDKDGTAKGTYTRGMEIKGRQVSCCAPLLYTCMAETVCCRYYLQRAREAHAAKN